MWVTTAGDLNVSANQLIYYTDPSHSKNCFSHHCVILRFFELCDMVCYPAVGSSHYRIHSVVIKVLIGNNSQVGLRRQTLNLPSKCHGRNHSYSDQALFLF